MSHPPCTLVAIVGVVRLRAGHWRVWGTVMGSEPTDKRVQYAKCSYCHKGVWRSWGFGTWFQWTHPARMKGGCRKAMAVLDGGDSA